MAHPLLELRPHITERWPAEMFSPWYLEIVRVSSREKQQDLLTLLREVVSVTALGSSSGAEHYVVFECSDLPLRRAIEKLFTEADPASVRIQTHRHPLEREGGALA